LKKTCFNLSDENYGKLRQLAHENNVDMVDIINMSIARFDESQERREAQENVRNLQIAVRNCENKIGVLYAALNNFFLNFAGEMEEYVPPEKVLHCWLSEAEKEQVARLRQMAAKKKWTGHGS
jgi:hypothetical protein